MTDYEGRVRAAKDHVNRLILQMCGKNPPTPEEMSAATGDLNKAWDEFATMLWRRVKERDGQISRLLNELSERPSR